MVLELLTLTSCSHSLVSYSNCPDLACCYVELFSDSTFKFEFYSDIAVTDKPTFGTWKVTGDTIVFNSYLQPIILSASEKRVDTIQGVTIALMDSLDQPLRFFFNSLEVDGEYHLKSSIYYDSLGNETFLQEIKFPQIKRAKHSVGFFFRGYRYLYTLKDTLSNYFILRLNLPNDLQAYDPPIPLCNDKYLMKNDCLYQLDDNNKILDGDAFVMKRILKK
jgi:hypothetical protein